MLSIPQFLGCLAALYVGWRILHSFLLRSPLHNIPGPTSDSFISGKLTACADRTPTNTR